VLLLQELGYGELKSVIIQIKVKPRSRVSSLEQVPDGTWVAKLKSPPIDGKANKELVALVAEYFQCRKTAVTIKTGKKGLTKLVKVDTLQ